MISLGYEVWTFFLGNLGLVTFYTKYQNIQKVRHISLHLFTLGLVRKSIQPRSVWLHRNGMVTKESGQTETNGIKKLFETENVKVPQI